MRSTRDLVHLAGEIHELKTDLNSLDRNKRKDTVKKVIAAMTVGKDVAALFPGERRCPAAAGTPPCTK